MSYSMRNPANITPTERNSTVMFVVEGASICQRKSLNIKELSTTGNFSCLGSIRITIMVYIGSVHYRTESVPGFQMF